MDMAEPLPRMMASATPAPALARADGIERRANERALGYWREVAAPRRYPAFADIDLDSLGDLREHLFVVEIGGSVEDYRMVAAGGVIADAFGRDPTGHRVAEVLPQKIRKQSLYRQEMTARLGTPLDETGHWVDESGAVVLYRSILLPLSDDQRHINYLLGAFSFRRAE